MEAPESGFGFGLDWQLLQPPGPGFMKRRGGGPPKVLQSLTSLLQAEVWQGFEIKHSGEFCCHLVSSPLLSPHAPALESDVWGCSWCFCWCPAHPPSESLGVLGLHVSLLPVVASQKHGVLCTGDTAGPRGSDPSQSEDFYSVMAVLQTLRQCMSSQSKP